ncbi:anthranilate synthase family protein [Krasilnikovia sp. MM14-A1259]|uniref:anthranilate synthase family protein n=1 Tax=Krasilnikovia sp. MM14-A1259 TaxID=3373539 RepID=UPI0038108D99
MTSDLLDRVLGSDGLPFALLHRPGTTGDDRIDVLVGDVTTPARVADIPLPPRGSRGRHEVLAVLPYRQIAERGFACPDDGTPLLALTVTAQARVRVAEAMHRLPDQPIHLDDATFDADDDQYAATVRRVIAEEIGQGTGANFVIKRTFTATVRGWSARTALAVYRRLLGRDPGSHWTFLVHAGGRTLVGASPERHISLASGTAVMNPISGTYRYPADGPKLSGVLSFLSDAKEANELYMVLDEELKMMGRVCELGGRAVGPYLKPMARVAHTEYLIEGHTRMDVRDVLRATMFAPTVTGGPVESACRVISKFEPDGRGYYAGVLALIGRDASGARALDSAIAIRTADIDAAGRLRLSVGATLVRDSDPVAEAAETRAKAAGLLDALRATPPPRAPATVAGSPVPVEGGPVPVEGGTVVVARLGEHRAVRQALAQRNTPLGRFWFDPPAGRRRDLPALRGRRLLVIDAEDNFTLMARHLIGSLGCEVHVRRFDEQYDLHAYDLVIVGPGPGDPTDPSDAKVAHLRSETRRLLASDIPFLAVCLGHQVLSTVLGLPIERNPRPNQGVQREIDVFGRSELVGFYNTFAARAGADVIPSVLRPGTVAVSRDARTGEVHALRGPGFASVQFHPVSVLTRSGVEILGDVLGDLLTDGPRGSTLSSPATARSVTARSATRGFAA